MIRYFLLVLMLPSLALAQDPTPAVEPIPAVNPWLVWPVMPAVNPPLPVPAPIADPDAVPLLPARTLFVIQSDTEFFLRANPKGLVTIRRVSGPRDISGVFADGNGKDEDRSFDKAFIAIVKAVEGKAGRVMLTAIPKGVESDNAITEMLVDIGAAPQPPPDVDPKPPTPQPPVVVVPTGFRVMFVKDPSKPLEREQQHIWHSTKIRAYLSAKCVKSDKNQPEWRFWDKGMKVTDMESKTIADMWTAAQPSLTNLPVIVIHANGKGEVLDWPATEDATLELLKTYGGA